jgi:hypothetical protein
MFNNALTRTIEGDKRKTKVISIILILFFIAINAGPYLHSPHVHEKKKEGEIAPKDFLKLYDKMQKNKH